MVLLVTSSSDCFAQRATPLGFRSSASRSLVPAGPPDSFTGPDKVKHFFMSGFIEAIGFAALQGINVNRGVSLGAATAATLGIGVAREVHDKRTKGLFSLGDLTWDTLGTGAALLLISHTQRQEPPFRVPTPILLAR